MITSKTPLRVSFLGGGTDYPEFSSRQIGRVLGTAINLYVYVSVLPNNNLSTPGFRLNYSVHEDVNEAHEFKHPVVRTVLADNSKFKHGLSISTLADVPARSGLGSSSTFTVGLLNALHASRGEFLDSTQLADGAVEIERFSLNEAGGYQDQYHAAVGGFNLYEFSGRKVSIQPVSNSNVAILDESMYLVSVGQPRDSFEHAAQTSNFAKTIEGQELLPKLSSLTGKVYEELSGSTNPYAFLGILADGMNDAWLMKKQFSKSVSDYLVDETIQHGIKHGALSGKLCGAGGSGFILFLVPLEAQPDFEFAFSDSQIKKIGISPVGSQII